MQLRDAAMRYESHVHSLLLQVSSLKAQVSSLEGEKQCVAAPPVSTQPDEPSDLMEINILSQADLKPSADAKLTLMLMLQNVRNANTGKVMSATYMCIDLLLIHYRVDWIGTNAVVESFRVLALHHKYCNKNAKNGF